MAGGFVAGNLDAYDNPLRSVANRCECIVVSVAYRLAPDDKYPAAPDDAYAATKWVAENASKIGGDPAPNCCGRRRRGWEPNSSGYADARERGAPSLVFQVLIYPSLDFSTMRPSWWEESDAPTVSREAKRDISIAYLPITANLRDPSSLRSMPRI